ncbi:hypothetical protein QMK33_02195 [Hymenobacter sp. H14-R3]|uniref:hypothetical protein n=1 Tax=Hymenobacter sp. H14-R3 TaxID=3046308 RepID=UPI0024B9B6CE|nr:hypothetical protein [Hymenobacter sp. H14-R3]MDJ0363947.1 hypothetical protein [Hymenobacter sp. H14-R3]
MTRKPQFSSNLDTHTIRIQAEKSGCLLGFLLFWLSGWLVGGFFAIRALVLGLTIGPPSMGSPTIFLLKWLAMWLIGLLVFGYLFFWQLVGQEVVTLAGGVLRIRQKVGPLGTTQNYDVHKIRYLRTQPDEWPTSLAKNQRSEWGSGSVLFDYGAETIRFGKMLREAEAARIVGFLQQHHVSVHWAFEP